MSKASWGGEPDKRDGPTVCNYILNRRPLFSFFYFVNQESLYFHLEHLVRQGASHDLHEPSTQQRPRRRHSSVYSLGSSWRLVYKRAKGQASNQRNFSHGTIQSELEFQFTQYSGDLRPPTNLAFPYWVPHHCLLYEILPTSTTTSNS